MIEADIAIVGAGPAGSAAALGALTADPGARVVLMDRAAFPRDKICGDGVGPEAVEVLRRLGAEAVLDGYPPLSRVRLHAPDGTVARGCAPRAGYVVPRAILDARFRDVALSAGARPMQHRLRSVTAMGGWVHLDDVVRARTVIGADGANGVVRRAIGARSQPLSHTGVAIRGYAVDDTLDELVIGFVEDRWPAYVWAFPTGNGLVNVGYGPFDGRLAGDRASLTASLRRHARSIGVAADPDSLRAHRLPLSTRRPALAVGRVLLVGDAASLVNPLTGEGIYYAMLSGAMAGRAAVRFPAEPGAAYAGAVRGRLARHLRHTSAAALAFRSPYPVDHSVAAAARSRRVFEDLCEFALGTGLLTPSLVSGLVRASFLTALRGRPLA